MVKVKSLLSNWEVPPQQPGKMEAGAMTFWLHEAMCIWDGRVHTHYRGLYIAGEQHSKIMEVGRTHMRVKLVAELVFIVQRAHCVAS